MCGGVCFTLPICPVLPRMRKVALFADDAKCYINMKNSNDCQLLQNDLHALDWSNTWELNFHPSKLGRKLQKRESKQASKRTSALPRL